MRYNILITAVISTIFSTHLMAAMTISGTRVIFPGGEQEVTVRTVNKGDAPALVQVWVDDGDSQADVNAMKVPFVVTPPVYRVEPGKGQSLRLIYNNMALPGDKESVFWLNMLEIPPVYKGPAKDRLELAFRTRIKIFYRPKSLSKSDSSAQADKLKWAIDRVGKKLKINNPTPYYFSFESINLLSGSQKQSVHSDMVSPFSSSEFTLTKNSGPLGNVTGGEFRLLNDYGAILVGSLKASGDSLDFVGFK